MTEEMLLPFMGSSRGLFHVKQGSVEHELLGLIPGRISDRDVRIFGKRFGWDGEGGATLDSVGRHFGVTRERIRQICVRVKRSLRRRRVPTPTLDKCILRLEMNRGSPVQRVATEMASDGLLTSPAGIEAVYSTAEVLGRAIPARENSLLIRQRAQQIARRLASKHGVARLGHVCDVLGEKYQINAGDELVREALSGCPGGTWLDNKREWFTFHPTHRNRLGNQISKILRVTEEIRLAELREAARRHYRTEGFAPPEEVLATFITKTELGSVSNGLVRRDAAPPDKQRIGGLEATIEGAIVDVITESGGAIRREELERRCLERGVNRNSFYVALGNSPLVRKVAVGVYALAGRVLSPSEIETLRRSKRKSKVVTDYGWTEGKLWLDIKPSRATMASGVVGIPAAIAPELSGAFELTLRGGDCVGRLTCKHGYLYGWLRKVIKEIELENGFRLEFEHSTRKATLSILHDRSLSAPKS